MIPNSTCNENKALYNARPLTDTSLSARVGVAGNSESMLSPCVTGAICDCDLEELVDTNIENVVCCQILYCAFAQYFLYKYVPEWWNW